jgi:FkbM family methyltransferase
MTGFEQRTVSQQTELYKRCKSKGYKPAFVAEIGVYIPETSNVINFIEDGVETLLVEADPKTVEKIKSKFGSFKNVVCKQVAVFDHNGTVKLAQRASSTFISSLKSPAVVNDRYAIKEEDEFEVQAVTFDTLDDGQIDLLSIDIEGAEWFVLKHMKSRPMVISIETHGKYYINPYLDEINQWIDSNSYVVWYRDKSDTVYVRKGGIQISSGEKISLLIKNLQLSLRRLKGKIVR